MKLLKKIIKFALNNYFISIFIACIIFVGFVSVFKLFFTKPTYVYAKVKMGQGLWWASTAKPSIWYINAIKKGSIETNLTENPITEVLEVRYYPWNILTNQYDVYLYVKLKVSGSKKTKKYNFKRTTIGVGAPIDLEFPAFQVSGTIIELSEKPITDKYTYKIVTLTKKGAYPWEYDAIKVGDSYSDGASEVFKILAKDASDTSVIATDSYGNQSPGLSEVKKYITIKANIKLKSVGDQFIFGEEQVVSLGKPFIMSTSSFTSLSSQDYVVAKIE